MRSFEATSSGTTLAEVVSALVATMQQRSPEATVSIWHHHDAVRAAPGKHDLLTRPLDVPGWRVRVTAPTLSAEDVAFVESLIAPASLALAGALQRSSDDPSQPTPPEGDAHLEPRLELAAGRWELTMRQRLVLLLAARGLSNKEIARSLGRSVRTVEAHMSQILTKARVDSRGALVARLWGTREEQ